MRYILLSADNEPTLYEAPDAVAEGLFDYAMAFRDSIQEPDSPFWQTVRDPSGECYSVLFYDEQDFVSWLNRQPVTRNQPAKEAEGLSLEDREIIMETARKERYLPYEQMQYPWYNF